MDKLIATVALLAVAFFSAPALADSGKEGAAGTHKLEALTVTAQKQEENVQEVPISISVYDAPTIEDKNVDSLLDLSEYIPNVMLYQNGHPGIVAPSFRGINAPGTSLSVSAGLYVDGVPVVSSAGFESDLLDIERIEVLRGPQGTIYGKGAEAGVINIVSKKPGNEFHGKAMALGGEDKRGQLLFNLRGPIFENRLFFSVAGNFYRKDGYVKNVVTGKNVDDREYASGRGQLRWTPTDDWDISLTASRRRDDNGAARMNLTAAGAAMMRVAVPEDRKVSSGLKAYEKPETDSQSLKVAYDLSKELTLTSITSHWLYKDKAAEDFDFSAATIFETHKKNQYRTINEELRLDYSTDRLKWLMGLYFESSKKDFDYHVNSIVPAMRNVTRRSIDGHTYAAFANANYTLTDKFGLVAGLRYEREKQEFEDHLGGRKADTSWGAWSPKLALEYRIVPEVMSYVSVSKGYRSGGFNWATPNVLSYDQEELWSYEIGIKSGFLDNRLIVNGAVYYMDISDMQVEEAVTPGNVYTTNAAKATSRGFELEANYLVMKGLRVNAGYGYTDITFDSFADAAGDHKGNRVPFAPEHTFNVGASYRHDSGVYVGGDVVGCGKMYFDKTNRNARDAYTLVNAKVGYETEHFDGYLYAKNLFDEKYDSTGYMDGMYTIYSDPREIGIQAVYRF